MSEEKNQSGPRCPACGADPLIFSIIMGEAPAGPGGEQTAHIAQTYCANTECGILLSTQILAIAPKKGAGSVAGDLGGGRGSRLHVPS